MTPDPEPKANTTPSVTDDERKKFEDEKKAFQKERLAHKRNQLIDLGYPAEKAAKLNSLDAIDALIEDYSSKSNKAANEEEEDSEDESEDEETESKPKVKISKSNAKSTATVKMPDGETLEIKKENMSPDTRTDELALMHFHDPQSVPRTPVLFQGARLNMLPPTDDKPYYRIIA